MKQKVAPLEHLQGVDPDTIDALKRSKRIGGELLPVIMAKFPDGSRAVVSGRHRKRAGWKKEELIEVKDEHEYWNLVIQYNVGRKPTANEWAELFNNVAVSLSKSGKSNEEIVHWLVEHSPFPNNWTYEYIPTRFKRPMKFRQPEIRTEDSPITSAEEHDGTVIKPREDEAPSSYHSYECPNCLSKLEIENGKLVLA